ncbi:MAG: hypothetical protein IPI67_35850 [Myxococcales bacterium]|nr:hypothetical protein [Myxococcales bacterium]
MAAPIDDASLVVGVRAFVLPAFLTRFVVYDGFTKFADESWRKTMPPEAYDLLRAKLDELVPMI